MATVRLRAPLDRTRHLARCDPIAAGVLRGEEGDIRAGDQHVGGLLGVSADEMRASDLAAHAANDRAEHLGGAIVHHGPQSDRAYLAKSGIDPVADIETLERLAAQNGYGKLFAKIGSEAAEVYVDAGFVTEACVPLRTNGDEVLFCSRFLDPARAQEYSAESVRRVLEACRQAEHTGDDHSEADLLSGIEIRLAAPDDVVALSALYADVFESYPFPITSPAFLEEAMETGTVFMVACEQSRIAAAASAEIDHATATFEMTDFATAASHRGQGLASALLGTLELEARALGVETAYTIARATSVGMNLVFARRTYRYGGTLVNNTGICGGIESMNVWHRPL